MKQLLVDDLRQKFHKYHCTHPESKEDFIIEEKLFHYNITDKQLMRCAVLVILFRANDQLNILLTIRSFKLKSFPGEIWYLFDLFFCQFNFCVFYISFFLFEKFSRR